MSWWRSFRDARRRRRAAARALDELFSDPVLLAEGRLAARHRARLNVLEIETDAAGEIVEILIGIIRHPRAHLLASRGENVLELLRYRPRERTLENVGGANLTRRKTT